MKFLAQPLAGLCLVACCLANAYTLRADESPDSPAAVLPPVNFQPGPEVSDTVRMWQGISGLERAAGGRLWATCYGGGVTEDRHNFVMLVTSGDDGKTWSELTLVIDPDGDGPVRAFDPVPWVDPGGKLWLFWCQATKGGGGDPFTFAITTDNPDDAKPDWSKPRMIHDGVMMCKPTVTSAGDWLLPTAIWRRENSCRVIASTDQGKTWKLRGTANVPDPKDRNCDEPMIVKYDANAGGQEMLAGSQAELELTSGEVAPLKEGVTLFTDRGYKLHELPAAFQGMRYVRGSIGGTEVKVRQGGVVFVATPTVGRNNDSIADDLVKQGFTLVKLPEFLLFSETNAPGNVCTTYQKEVKPGDSLKLGKWGVLIF